ncbi:hypothetical protein K431DRAFT_290110 [Polychaeton citri CBS 116435]|uniref:F-box domain-containing protein n=1 Tax=Polychaeton citri CBS 116435 TaxID=1314669 RepID=A0A9P4QFC2_9PEZI|nr:hypothetical protein K431DRAFT_290110 [Polychaeton citri CBS 116435]
MSPETLRPRRQPTRPRPAPITTAAQQVLHTPELLEQVLLQLPFSDLWICAQVCLQWRTLTFNSKPLLRTLFLHPATSSRQPPRLEESLVSVNPPVVHRVHPALESSSIARAKRWQRIRSPHLDRNVNFVMYPARMAGWPEEGALWRRMLVSQPPCWRVLLAEEVEVVVAEVGSVGIGEDGLTLGDLWDGVERLRGCGMDVPALGEERLGVEGLRLFLPHSCWDGGRG